METRRLGGWITAGMAASLSPRAKPAEGSSGGKHAGLLQLHQNHVDQCGNRRAPGLDDEMRRLPVQRVALRVEGAQPLHRVVDLQEGSLVVVPHPKKDLGKGLLAAIRKQAGL